MESIRFLNPNCATTLEIATGYDRASRGSIATREQRRRLPVAGDPDALLRVGGKSWFGHGWDKSVHRHKPGSSQHPQ